MRPRWVDNTLSYLREVRAMKRLLVVLLVVGPVVTCLGADPRRYEWREGDTGKEWYKRYKEQKGDRDADDLRDAVEAAAKRISQLERRVHDLEAENRRLAREAKQQHDRADKEAAKAQALRKQNADLSKQLVTLREQVTALRSLRLGVTAGQFAGLVKADEGKGTVQGIEVRTGGDATLTLRLLPRDGQANELEASLRKHAEGLGKNRWVTAGWISQGKDRWVTSLEQQPE